jgi:hypothetical protein
VVKIKDKNVMLKLNLQMQKVFYTNHANGILKVPKIYQWPI